MTDPRKGAAEIYNESEFKKFYFNELGSVNLDGKFVEAK